MISPHIDVGATRSRDLLKPALRSRRSAEIIQAADDLEHCRQSYLTDVSAQTRVWSQAVVDVCFKISSDVHFIGIWEELGFTVRADLRKYQHLHVRGVGSERRTKLQKTLSPAFTETSRPLSSIIVDLVAWR